MLNINDVNKRILAKSTRSYLKNELSDVNNKYRDQNYNEYLLKCEEFKAVVEKYRNLNKEALVCNSIKLDTHSDELSNYQSQHVNESQAGECIDKYHEMGTLIKKRTLRRIHQVVTDEVDVCSLEPWFGRYLKLCKFIYAVRTVILKNRLLKNLEILKRLDVQTVMKYEALHRKYQNVSYAYLFDKYNM